MDEESETIAADPVVITGTGIEASEDIIAMLSGLADADDIVTAHDADPSAFLRNPKTRKFLSKQDRMALLAAGKAIKASGADREMLANGCGVFMSVGYIPYEQGEAENLCRLSAPEGSFSMKAFSTHGYESVNPLRAFSCLPNMPAHHLSANFDIQGQYFITYPGTAEFYLALQEAVHRLREGSTGLALVGAVADQNNFLVENHLRKLHNGGSPRVADASAFIMLELENTAAARKARPLARLLSMEIKKGTSTQGAEKDSGSIEYGAVDLPLKLSTFIGSPDRLWEHSHSRKDFFYKSIWECL